MLGLSQSAFSQNSPQFQIAYGGTGLDKGVSVEVSPDGGYAAIGFTNSFGAGDLDIYVVRTDAFGTVQWSRTYGGTNLDDAATIKYVTGGGYIIIGRTRSYGGTDNKAILIKIDDLGIIEWSKVYDTPGNLFFRGIRPLSGGGYIAVGQADVGQGSKDIVVARFDALGDVVWVKSYGNGNGDFADHIEASPCGGFLVLGERRQYTPGSIESMIMYLDDNGALVWAKSYSGAATDQGLSTPDLEMFCTQDKGILVSGITNSFGAGAKDGMIYKTDSLGNLLWAKTYGGANDDIFNTVKELPSGELMSCGLTNSFGSGQSDIFCVLVDSIGDPQRALVYGTTGNDALANIDDVFQTLSDGSLIMSGFTNGFGQGGDDMYLIKTDASGFSGCNETQLAAITTTNPPLIEQVVNPVVGNVTLTSIAHSLQTSVPATADSIACFTDGFVPYSDWTTTDDMIRARRFPASALLASGRVMVAGGFDGSDLNSAEIYDPNASAGNRWSSAANMPVTHRRHGIILTAASPQVNKVLIVGEDAPNRTAHLYTESIGGPGTWASTVNGPSETRYSAELVELPNGKVLYPGGYCGGSCPTFNSVDLYDPITNSWSATGPLAVQRYAFTATLLTVGPNSGKVLVTGGAIRIGVLVHSSTEIYDPITELWSSAAPMNSPRARHAATVLPDGKVLVSGGFDANQVPLASAEIYDPVNDTWTPTGSMNYLRQKHTQTNLPDGRVLVAGGRTTTNTSGTIASTEFFDHFSGLWVEGFPMNIARGTHEAVSLPDGTILLIGGMDANGIALTSTEIFNTPLDPPQFRQAPDGGFLIREETKIVVQEGTTINLNGDFAVGGVEIFDNAGTINLTGDYINEVEGRAYSGAPGSIGLTGSEKQTIRGTQDATFNHLKLSGGGEKRAKNDLIIEQQLDLADERLDIGTNTVRISNPSVGAVNAGSGFINTTQGGTVVRATETTDSYTTPIGIICDPALVDPTAISVTIRSDNGDEQEWELGSIDQQGVTISHNENLIAGTSETVDIKTNKGGSEQEFRYDIDAQGDVLNVQFKDKFDGAYKQLDESLFAIGSLQLLSLCDEDFYPPRLQCSTYPVNSLHVITFDENGNIIQESKEFTDLLGRGVQTQVRNIEAGVDIGTEVILDSRGRAAIFTLPAPIGTSLTYNPCFVTNMSDNKFNYLDFDVTSKVNNPNDVNDANQYTLGHYYSENSVDNHVAVSGNPYTRIEYAATPGGAVKRIAKPGDNYKMGGGHESEIFQMHSAGELKYIFGVNKSFKVSMNSSDPLLNSPITISGDIIAVKTIEVNEQGKERISYAVDGLPIASCLTGVSTSCNFQIASSVIGFGGNRSVDVHIPIVYNDQLKLPIPRFKNIFGTFIPLNSNQYDYRITDLRSETLLVEGSDYAIAQDRSVAFLGQYSTESLFLRIGIEYDAAFENFITLFPGLVTQFPNVEIEYYLDYSNWDISYYDLGGNMRKTVPPKGIDCNNPGVQTMSTTFDYNGLGQLISQNSPEQGLSEFTYSDEGRPRFSQNSVQRSSDEFSYVNYDRVGRIIESGVFDPPSTGPFFQNHYLKPVISTGSSVVSILNEGDGLDDSRSKEQEFTIYDNLAVSQEIPSTYTYKGSYTQEYMNSGVVKTYSSNSATWYSYDQFGQLTFMVQQIKDADYITQNSSIDQQIKTIDFTSNTLTGLLLAEEYQKNETVERLKHTYQYDQDLRLIGSVAENSLGIVGSSSYEYYLTGEIKRTELDDGLQGMDYVYTINGQIKSINHPSLDANNDPGLDGATGSPNVNVIPDLFGMTIDYHQNDYKRNGTNIISSVNSSQQGLYDGLIYAVRYNITSDYGTHADQIITTGESLTTGADDQLITKYVYDDLLRLSSSTFGVYHNTNVDPDLNTATLRDDFKVFGNSVSGGISYDKNGNITSLKRNGYGIGGDFSMDYLDYHYPANSDMLASINDEATIGTGAYNTDIDASSTKSFTYTALGQLESSQAEGVKDITYHANRRVKKVTFDNDNTAEYFYNDRGIKVKTKFTDISTSATKTSWYVTDYNGDIVAVYEQESANGSSINLAIQPIYGNGRIGVYDCNMAHVVYEIKDHLNNVRVTFKEVSGVFTVESWADYYPFGSPIPGRNSNMGTYKFSYQGQENVVESNWTNFEFRMYSSGLGRFLSVDPESQFFSPYVAMGNNPAVFTDPTGAVCPGCSGGGGGGLSSAFAAANAAQEQYNDYLDANYGRGDYADGGPGDNINNDFDADILKKKDGQIIGGLGTSAEYAVQESIFEDAFTFETELNYNAEAAYDDWWASTPSITLGDALGTTGKLKGFGRKIGGFFKSASSYVKKVFTGQVVKTRYGGITGNGAFTSLGGGLAAAGPTDPHPGMIVVNFTQIQRLLKGWFSGVKPRNANVQGHVFYITWGETKRVTKGKWVFLSEWDRGVGGGAANPYVYPANNRAVDVEGPVQNRDYNRFLNGVNVLPPFLRGGDLAVGKLPGNTGDVQTNVFDPGAGVWIINIYIWKVEIKQKHGLRIQHVRSGPPRN